MSAWGFLAIGSVMTAINANVLWAAFALHILPNRTGGLIHQRDEPRRFAYVLALRLVFSLLGVFFIVLSLVSLLTPYWHLP